MNRSQSITSRKVAVKSGIGTTTGYYWKGCATLLSVIQTWSMPSFVRRAQRRDLLDSTSRASASEIPGWRTAHTSEVPIKCVLANGTGGNSQDMPRQADCVVRLLPSEKVLGEKLIIIRECVGIVGRQEWCAA